MKKLSLTALAVLIAFAPVHARKKDNKKKNKDKTEVAAPAKKPEPKPSISRQGLFNVEKVEKEWLSCAAMQKFILNELLRESLLKLKKN